MVKNSGESSTKLERRIKQMLDHVYNGGGRVVHHIISGIFFYQSEPMHIISTYSLWQALKNNKSYKCIP